MDKQKFILSLVGILALALIVSLALWPTDNDNEQNYTMTVSAQGEVVAKPDVAVINVGVRSERQMKIEDVMADNTAKMNRITKALKDAGIDEGDMKTINYNLRPVYDYIEDRGRVLQGYEIEQSLEVKIRDLDEIGEIINLATQNGANQVSNANFTIDDPEEYKNEAREIAIDSAKQKAKSMARLSGINLGRVVNVSESFSGGVTPMYADSMMMKGMGGANEASPEISVGENEISVTVNLTYEVK